MLAPKPTDPRSIITCNGVRWTRHAVQRLAERFNLGPADLPQVCPPCSSLISKAAPLLGEYRILCPHLRAVLVLDRAVVVTIYADGRR